MKRNTTALLTPALLLLGLAWLATPAFARPPKIEICHIPPLTPDNVRTILVGPKAAAKHMAEHGDFEVGLECSEGVGECEVFGETVCVAGEDVCTASAVFPPPEPTEVSCDDGLDNDCDGLVDTEDMVDCTCPCFSQQEALALIAACEAGEIEPTFTDILCREESTDEEFRTDTSCKDPNTGFSTVLLDAMFDEGDFYCFAKADPPQPAVVVTEAEARSCRATQRQLFDAGVCDEGP